jgi:apolipoprotein N-acyltransferase
MGVDENSSVPLQGSTLPIALIGSCLLWAALPPLAIGWLGWIAPVPWLVLVARRELPSRRPYLALYVAGLAFWLATIHWLRLPHPLVYFGWFALSAYLACYLPVFVGLSRVAVHRLRAPLWLAAPVVWTGLELARAHIMTGFLMASLAHTQAEWPPVIQIADVFGEYGVDFLMVLVAACVAQAMVAVIERRQGDRETSRRSAAAGRQGDSRTSSFSLSPPLPATAGLRLVSLSLLPAAVALMAALAYGRSRLSDLSALPDARTVRVALIQGNSLADWKFDAAKQRQIMDEYVRLSHEAVTKARATGDGRPLDLVVWPETMFRVPLMSFNAAYQLPPGTKQSKVELAAVGPRELGRLVAAVGAPVLVGIDRLAYQSTEYSVPSTDANSDLDNKSATVNPPTAYNSAVLVDRGGQIVGTYDKFHLVMFGEYVPFSRWLPFLKEISSLTGSVDAGEGPVGLTLGGTTYVPNICYETVIPHVIRNQVNTLIERSESPNVLVNLTNDAWYWGSSELEQHLASGVFRAIETRRPLVIAANGGISAWIDHTGRIRAHSPKMQTDTIIADVEIVYANSLYRMFGDWLAGACLMCCIALAAIGWRARKIPLNPEP